MRPSKKLAVLGLVVLSLAGAGAAAAGWSHTSTVDAHAKAVSVPTGSTPTKVVSYPDIAVSWPAVTIAGAAVSSYTIRRYSETGALQAITAGCNGAVAATTCTENNLPAGRWQYTTQPVKAAWVGPESAKSAVAEIAAPPTAVSCTNCTLFGSTVYVNDAHRLSVSIGVTLAASSLATDTVHLTLTDRVGTVVTAPTRAAPSGAATLSFTGLDTSTLVDGNLTATAWVTTNTSEQSSNAVTTLVRDTVVPAAADVAGTNGGTAGTIDAADSVVYTFSEPMAPASIRSGWSGASTAVTSTITPGTLNDAITVSGSSLGTVNTHVDYVLITAATCSSTLTSSGSTITLTIGSCSFGLGGSFAPAANSSTFDWAPSTAATDRAGNPITSTSAVESGGPKANF